MVRLDATFSVAYRNEDDRGDIFHHAVPASAVDNSDKAPGKVASYATKTSMLKVFLIETGENTWVAGLALGYGF